VEGLTEQDARERLAEAGFETEVRPRKSPEEDAGRVLEQSASGGKGVEEGRKILLTVGEAPEVAKVPEVVGLSYLKAENAWRDRDFSSAG
jgi:beta-lactam-binding protein with PASTA domain